MTAAKHRFFIALIPPPPIQEYANQVKQDFADRYQSRAAFRSPPHITLQPPFEWSLAELPRLQTCLQHFATVHSPVPVTLSGFGAFPPRVIFINVVKSVELLALQRNLEDYCASELGITHPHRGRPFSPHLTVAFRDLSRQNFQVAWPVYADRSLQFEFMATELTLLSHEGSRWTVHSNYPLAVQSAVAPQGSDN